MQIQNGSFYSFENELNSDQFNHAINKQQINEQSVQEYQVKMHLSYDDLLDQRIQMGRYQTMNILGCLIFFFCDGIDKHIITYISQFIKFHSKPIDQFCNHSFVIYLSILDLNVLIYSVYVSSILGYYIGGILSDKFGRKKLIIYGNIILLIFGILSSIAHSLTSFIIYRSLVSFGIGLGYTSAISLVCEICPSIFRGRKFILLYIFNSLGILVFTVFAKYYMKKVDNQDVKIFIIQTNIFPVILFLLLIFFQQESPRHLLINHKYDESFSIIERAIIRNNQEEDIFQENERKLVMNWIESQQLNKHNKGRVLHLYSQQYILKTLFFKLLYFINETVKTTFYLLIPKLFSSDLIQLEKQFLPSVFRLYFIAKAYIIIIVENILLILILCFIYLSIDFIYIGRKNTIILLTMINIACFSCSFQLSQYIPTFYFCVYMSTQTISCILDIYSCEQYSTQLRSTSLGLFRVFAKLAVLFAYQFCVELYVQTKDTFLIVMLSVSVFQLLMLFLGPKCMTKKQLKE